MSQATSPATTHSTMDSIKNGPMADKARLETDKTSSELSNLAASRQTPTTKTATGQDLTHYHSFFYNLLSWENPRATAISYASIVVLIFATRYLPLVRYSLKALYMILGITAAAEIAGKTVMGQGVASKMRPKRYYTLPKEWLETIMDDATELINFFVIEFQRVLFAENVAVTAGVSSSPRSIQHEKKHTKFDSQAFTATLLTYFLIKITPAWGLALLFTTMTYFTPLIYIKNQELIDGHLNNASDIISKQTQQVRELAGQHAGKAGEMAQGAFKDYSTKAGEMMGSAKKAAVEKGIVSEETAAKVPGEVKKEDFPSAPDAEPVVTQQHDGAVDEKTLTTESEQEPLLA